MKELLWFTFVLGAGAISAFVTGVLIHVAITEPSLNNSGLAACALYASLSFLHLTWESNP